MSNIQNEITLQRKNLYELYQIIQPEIPLFKKLSGIIADKGLMDSVISIIRGEYGSIRGEYNVDQLIVQLTNLPTNPEAPNPVIEQTNNLIKNFEFANRKAAIRVKVTDKEISISNLRLSTLINNNLSESDKHLFIAWINEVFSKDEYNGRTSTFKEQLSDDVTFKAKDIFNTEWDSSKAKAILNDLRRHVRGNEFNYNWEENIFSALASVITKGDDWQKLLSFMQVKELTDYKLAFAIYGTLNGFANLPRDFSDLLYDQDREYVADVYKEFYKQLFGFEIVIENIPANIQTDPVPKATITQPTEVSAEITLENDGDFEWLFTVLRREYKGGKKTREKFEDYYGKYLDTLCQVYDDRAELFKQIEQIPELPGTGTAWKRVRKAILSELKKVQETKPSETNQSLFSEQNISTGEFLKDIDFLSRHEAFTNQALLCSKKWDADLRWFISEHNPTSKYYAGKPCDNKSVIDRFCSLKNGRYASLKELLYKLYL